MVRRIYPTGDHLLDHHHHHHHESFDDGDEWIRTTTSADDEGKQLLLTPVRIRRVFNNDEELHSPPDIFRVGEGQSDEFPSIHEASNLLLPDLEDEDEPSSPTGVDCRTKDLYPFYDDYGLIQLVPKSHLVQLVRHNQYGSSAYLESPDISLVDLLSEVSDDETAELSAGDNSEADDGDETSVGGSVPVDTPAPLQPTISELNDGPPANMYGYSITRRDNGTEEYKDDNEDDGNDEIRELRSRDRYRHTRSVLSDNSLVAERNPRRGLPVSSRNQILESPWEYFMDCFTCSACSAICR